MSDNKIGLEAVFENEDFQKGISEYNKSVSDSSDSTESAGSKMSDIWDGLASVGAIAFQALAIGIAAMTAELYVAVDAAMDAEQVMARMEFVVDNVGERTGVTSDEVREMADALSQIVPIDDEVITSAITMGLTFDGVNQDNIQPLITAAADLATWTGRDLPSAMRELSLSISDPDKAMRLFKSANITLTDAQEKALKKLKETGDTASTTEFILDRLREKGIIGLGEAMGDTAKGKMTIMQTALGNLQEALGSGLLNSLSDVFDRITEFANDPRTVTFFTELGIKIGGFAETVLDKLPDVFTVIENLSTWFVENKPIIVGVLAALGVAMAAFGIIAAFTAISTIASFAPIIAVMAVVGVVVGLLYKAWTENWGGIQEKVAEVWAVLEPIFDGLMAWLSVNVPLALEALSEFWTNVLLPAIQTVFEWAVNNLIPLFISLVQWLTTNVPLAIQNLSNFWTNTLLPAITAVWGWISTNLIPLFNAIARLMNVVMTLAITALAGLWQNVLQPAIQAVADGIRKDLNPIFEAAADIVNNVLLPALGPLSEFLSNVLAAAFDGITEAIQFLIGWIEELITALSSIELPPWLTPGSPTPLELGLRGINEQFKDMAKAALPAVAYQLNLLATVRDVPGSSMAGQFGSIVNTSHATRNYLFGARFNVSNQSGLQDILNGLR